MTISHADRFQEKYTYPTKFLDVFCTYLKDNNSKILDVGCGAGNNCRFLYKKGFNVMGIDISSEMLKFARSKSPEISFYQMDMRKFFFKPFSFDALLCTFSIIYMEKQQAYDVIKKFHDMLKSDGLLYLAVHLGSKRVTIRDPLTHRLVRITLFEKNNILSYLQKIGFDMVWSRQYTPKNKNSYPFEKMFLILKRVDYL